MNGFGKMRKAAKMTQQAASDASGIPLSTLRRWEQGVNEPDVASIALLADLYGCTTDELLDIDVVRMPSKGADAAYSFLTDDERHLVDCFRSCTPEWRRTLLRSAEAYRDSSKASAAISSPYDKAVNE